jgi:hypothetical protein
MLIGLDICVLGTPPMQEALVGIANIDLIFSYFVFRGRSSQLAPYDRRPPFLVDLIALINSLL